MRAHGVPNFPDPGMTISGPHNSFGGIAFPATIDPQSPAFETAQTVCAKLLPGGAGTQRPSGQLIAKMRQIAHCMREHGVSGFPDPTFTMPSNMAGYSNVADIAGVILAVPATISAESPVFKQAASICHFGGPPRTRG
jgi:hypothetical protein